MTRGWKTDLTINDYIAVRNICQTKEFRSSEKTNENHQNFDKNIPTFI